MVVLVMQAVCILGISAVLSHPYWRKLGRSNREVCISSFPTSISELGLIDPTFARTGLHVEPKVKGSRMPERRPLAVRRKHLRTMSADDAEHVQETSVMTAAGKKGRDEGAVHQSAMNGELADAPGKQEVEATAQGQLVSSSQEQRVEYRMTDWEMRKLGELRTEMERKLSQQLTPEMRRFCSDPSLVRFLRARNWNVKKSLEFLRESLVFRHKYKPHLIRWDDVKEEGQSGKIYRMYKDKAGRPVMLMRPGRENTNNHEGQINFFIYNLEHAILQMESNDNVARGSSEDLAPEQMTWLVDFNGWGPRKAPPLKTGLETIYVLQTGYPERLGAAIFWNPPRMFETTWRVLSPFIDPETRAKIHFVRWKREDEMKRVMSSYFRPELVEKSLGGDLDYEFDLDEWSEKMRQEDNEIARMYESASNS